MPEGVTEGITDSFGRTVSYMRFSVTDRCNLSCFYCRSRSTPLFDHENILSYEELSALARLAKPLGVKKIRLTGGEPLFRPQFLSLLEMLREGDAELDLRITTNGTLLTNKVDRLKELGVSRLNISLDTLVPKKFKEITGVDAFAAVREGIDHCLEAGIAVKLNAVALKGINDSELPDFLKLAANLGLDVRFIEFMPMGGGTGWKEEYFWTEAEILEQAKHHADLIPIRSGKHSGPARLFTIDGGPGRLGIISPMSNHFCATCNRLRITSDGRLRTCLYSDKEYRLRNILRSPKLGPGKVLKVMRMAAQSKPLGYELLKARQKNGRVSSRPMSSIGG